MKMCMDCGHRTKGQGKRCNSCAAKARWADANAPVRKKVTSPEFRARMSEVAKALPHPELREHAEKRAAGIRAAHQRPEVKAKFSANMRSKWSDPEYRAMIIQAQNDGKREARVKYLPPSSSTTEFILRPSGLEIELANALDRYDVQYVQQYRPGGYWRYYDFLVPDQNLLIEVDGTYWHSMPKSAAVDAEKDAMATLLGYSLLRVSEEDLRTYGADCVVKEFVLFGGYDEE